jgi:hypothetical protein
MPAETGLLAFYKLICKGERLIGNITLFSYENFENHSGAFPCTGYIVASDAV